MTVGKTYTFLNLGCDFKRSSFEHTGGSSACPATSFSCRDGSQCVPGYEVCNANVACDDGSDEKESRKRSIHRSEDYFANAQRCQKPERTIRKPI